MSTPGVTDDTIRLGMPVAFSGDKKTMGWAIFNGFKIYCEWINDQGGVYGRKIQVINQDDRYDADSALDAVRELIEVKEVFAIVRPFGTPTGAAVLDYLTERQIPVVAPASGSSMFFVPFRRNYFGLQPTYTTEGRVFARYLVHSLHAERPAVFYEESSFGLEGAAALTQELATLGLEAVVIPNKPGDMEMGHKIAKLQAAHADVVVIYALPWTAAELIKQAAMNDYEPTWLLCYILVANEIFRLVGKDMKNVLAGTWTVSPTAPTEAAVAYRRRLETYASNQLPDGYSLSSDIAAQIVVEGLRRAGRDLTRDGFISALETFRDWETGLCAPITFTPDDHRGVNQIGIVRGRNYEWSEVVNFMERI